MFTNSAKKALADALDGGDAGLANFIARGDALDGAQVTRFDVTADLSDRIAGDVRRAATRIVNKKFVRYDPTLQTNSSTVFVEKLSQTSILARVDAEIRNGDNASEILDGPVVAMAHAAGPVVAYRLKGAGVATRRDRRTVLVPRQGVYGVAGVDVLQYEPRFDAFTCGPYVYFTSVTLISTTLHADKKARRLARDTFAAVTAHVRIDGIEELEKAVVNDPTLRAEMTHVSRLLQADPEYAERVRTKKVIKFLDGHPDHQVALSKVRGKKALMFDPADLGQRHRIPKLLADEELHAFVTGRS